MTDFRKTYAQNREDIILGGFFKDKKDGFYVDVGANHPVETSVTKLFYDMGWRGVNIEPSKRLHKLLTVARPRDINLQIGISNKNGTLKLREYSEATGLSTFSKNLQDAYQKHPSVFTDNHSDYQVKVQTLAEVFKEHHVPAIDFMKVDVEGLEYEVLQGNDWKKFRPKVLCIEANHIEKDWRPFLQKQGYQFVFWDGLNNYYVAKEHQKLAGNFSYVDTVLLKATPVYAEFYDKLEHLSWQLAQEGRKLARQEYTIEKLNDDITQLNEQLNARRRIRSLVVQLVRAVDAAILLQIDKLNSPRIYKSAKLPVLPDNRTQALSAIGIYDFQRYYGASTRTPLAYRVVHGLYAGLSGLAFGAARLIWRMTRGAKRRG